MSQNVPVRGLLRKQALGGWLWLCVWWGWGGGWGFRCTREGAARLFRSVAAGWWLWFLALCVLVVELWVPCVSWVGVVPLVVGVAVESMRHLSLLSRKRESQRVRCRTSPRSGRAS